MLINDDELLQELTDFLIDSSETYVEDAKTDYFVFGTGQPSFTEWLGKLVNTALHDDKFESSLPDWQGFDLTEDGYDSILFSSLLNNSKFKEALLKEFEYLEDMLKDI
jgi:hypothetical protein